MVLVSGRKGENALGTRQPRRGGDGALGISAVSGGRSALSSFLLLVLPRKIVMRSLLLQKEILVHCNIFMLIYPLSWSIIKPSGEIKFCKLHVQLLASSLAERLRKPMKSWQIYVLNN